MIEYCKFLKFIKISLVYCLVSLGVYGITVQPFYTQNSVQSSQNLPTEIEEEIHKFSFDILSGPSTLIDFISHEDLFHEITSHYNSPHLNPDIKPPIS